MMAMSYRKVERSMQQAKQRIPRTYQAQADMLAGLVDQAVGLGLRPRVAMCRSVQSLIEFIRSRVVA